MSKQTIKNAARRTLSLVLCLCMAFSGLTLPAYAAEGGGRPYVVTHHHVDGSQVVENFAIPYNDKPKDVIADPREGEAFAGVSISAGYEAVEVVPYDETSNIVAKVYGDGNESNHVPGVRQVKIDVLYRSTTLKQGDEFKNGEEASVNNEQDTYLCTEEGDRQNQWIYNTSAGLHTNKTATALDDGRTFDVKLENWFTGANTADVSMILDASGSMAFFAADESKAVSVNNTELVPDDKLNTLLDQDTVNQILSRNNTDNSSLSYSEYNYYVYDSRVNTAEYVPLGYWNGSDGTATASEAVTNGLVAAYHFDEDAELKNSANLDDKGDAKYVKREGSDESYSETEVTDAPNIIQKGALTLYDTTSSFKGVNLLLSPTSELDKECTISFAVQVSNTAQNAAGKDTVSEEKGILDGDNYALRLPGHNILHVEGSDGEKYYDIVRPTTGARARVRWYKNRGYIGDTANKGEGLNTNNTSSINGVFNNADEWVIVTYVIKDGVLDAYINGAKDSKYGGINNTISLVEGDEEFTLKGKKIFLGGQNYSGDSKLLVDEVYLYDRALSAGEVALLATRSENNVDKPKSQAPVGCAVLPGGAKMKVSNLDDLTVGSCAGWYYVNSSSDLSEIATYGSAKDLHPVLTSEMEHSGDAGGWGEGSEYFGPGETSGEAAGQGIGNKILKDETNGLKDGPCAFYVDSSRKLHCIFSADNKSLWDSVVYQKADSERIKAEQLQRAIDQFATQLNTNSPDSRLSAVRFSAKGFEDNLSQLVLLDWTNDPSACAGILSLDQSDTFSGFETSERGRLQYNYVLTGGTYTRTGVAAFENYLKGNSGEGREDANKYAEGDNNDLFESVKAAVEEDYAGHITAGITIPTGGTESQYVAESEVTDGVVFHLGTVESAKPTREEMAEALEAWLKEEMHSGVQNTTNEDIYKMLAEYLNDRLGIVQVSTESLAPVHVTLNATKTLTNGVLIPSKTPETGEPGTTEAKYEFTFTITPDNANDKNTDPIQGEIKGFETLTRAVTVPDAEEHWAGVLVELFRDWVYTTPGTYTYQVQEAQGDPVLGLKYDTAERTVTVTVTENAVNGRLEATITVQRWL